MPKEKSVQRGSLDPTLFVNRELSWMYFNQRVLDEAITPGLHPLLERVKFIAIFTSNLDEYFMIRVAGIEEQYQAGIQERTIDGFSPAEQLEQLRAMVIEQLTMRNHCFYQDIVPALKHEGIEFVRVDDLQPSEQKALSHYFRREIFPVLTPLAFDTGHPFPFMSNLSLNLALELEDEESGLLKFARVKVPSILPRLLRLNHIKGFTANDGVIRFVWLEDVIQHNLAHLFPDMKIVQSHLFRLIRDADIEIEEDEAGDLLQTIEQGLLHSSRYGKVVRIDVSPTMPNSMRELLIKNLEIAERNVYEIEGALGLGCLMELLKVERPNLKDEPFVPFNRLEHGQQGDIFTVIRNRDLLLTHPYDSFQPVVDFLHQAALDPNVLSIKQVLYRVGSNSPIVEALMRAAEEGKQVAVLVELKARFDEENNIVWAKALEDVGVHVVYGLPRLKTHAKVTMVVRREQHRLKRYLHLGTGNYNPVTSKIYTDYSFFTCNEQLANEVAELFNALTGYSRHSGYKKLIVSPINTRKRMLEMIERECDQVSAGNEGRIIMKMNSLVDSRIIRALYKASSKGVKIDLLIRGICSLKPNIIGISDTIRVISIIGRFLEHSRAYYFYNGGKEELYLGSADMMPRNLDNRVEVIFPITDKSLVRQVKGDLELMLTDTTKAWQMLPNGTYKRIANDENNINSQTFFMQRALQKKNSPKFKLNTL
uniref:Polyphosphate kinase n=1 Tax=Chlorobium chlorochromatii (strain CaD3) TaxID=340177 RepID=Q3AS60_CHLCH